MQITKEKVGAVMSETSNLLKRIVDSSYYQHFIMGAILVNTLSMGIEHHNQVILRFPGQCSKNYSLFCFYMPKH